MSNTPANWLSALRVRRRWAPSLGESRDARRQCANSNNYCGRLSKLRNRLVPRLRKARPLLLELHMGPSNSRFWATRFFFYSNQAPSSIRRHAFAEKSAQPAEERSIGIRLVTVPAGSTTVLENGWWHDRLWAVRTNWQKRSDDCLADRRDYYNLKASLCDDLGCLFLFCSAKLHGWLIAG